LLVLASAVDSVALGYFFTFAEHIDGATIIASTLRLIFDVYLLVLSVRLIGVDDVERHWEGVCHLCALTTIDVCLRATSLILPVDRGHVNALEDAGSDGLEWASFVLLIIACVTSVNAPRGPPLHYPPEMIYSPKILESFNTVPQSADNVCAVVQSSVWDFIFFSYTTAVANLGHTRESLEVQDLPIVPASYRASNLFAKMRLATVEDEDEKQKRRLERRIHGQKRAKKWFWQRQGSGFPLLARLARINAFPLGVEVGLAAVTAMLYYAPAWQVSKSGICCVARSRRSLRFLQHLVRYIEKNPDRSDKAWGWMYVPLLQK